MRILSVFILLTFPILTSAQKISFPRSHYRDSIIARQAIRDLANQTLLLYQHTAPDEKTNDNLFRLYLLAQRYQDMEKLLRRMNYEVTSDSSTAGPTGFQYQVYSTVLQHNPEPDLFDSIYIGIFKEKYNRLQLEEQALAENLFSRELKDLKSKYDLVKDQTKDTDSLTIDQAIALCRAYLSYTCYSQTLPLAKKLIQQVEAETYLTEDTVMVPMPDGGSVQLTVVRSKKEPEPQPVALMYSIYTGGEVSLCKIAVSKGYVGVIASTRGKRESKDEIQALENDARDAYFIIDWISKQPWCNGKVGMYGGSYLGFSQWSAVKNPHPALKTIVPQVAVGAGIDYPVQNGAFMSFMLRWLHLVSETKYSNEVGFNNKTYWDSLYIAWYRQGLPFRKLDSLQGKTHPQFQKWLDHPSYDTYWQNMTPQKEEFERIQIPVLTITGYYDGDQMGALYYYNEHVRWNKNASHYVFIGPYDHLSAQNLTQAVTSNYTIDEAAQVNVSNLVFEWFDHTLKDGPRPGLLKDKITYEVMGRNEWHSAPSLAEMAKDSLKFYLHPGQKNQYYSLSRKKPGKNTFIAQSVDFTDRSEIRVIPDVAGVGTYPYIIDSVLRVEKQKLVFMSEPLEHSLAICGGLSAELLACINKYDMDVVIDLFEQRPDGSYFALNQNIQRASYANNRSERQLLKPGKTERINIRNTFITAHQLQKGSRIVIVLGINKNPEWQVNYGTGGDVSNESILDANEPLQIKWMSGSSITIPVNHY